MNVVAHRELKVSAGKSVYKWVTQSTPKTYGHYSPTGSDFVGSFYAVLRRWQSETAFSSDPNEICSHPSFKALLDNAPHCLPLISDELERGAYHLSWVLEDYFGEFPYSGDEAGDLKRMAQRWVSYLEANDN